MKAMVLSKPGSLLEYTDIPVPEPGGSQVLVRVHACGVCRTDLHVTDGDLQEPRLPLVPGHEVVGKAVRKGGVVVCTGIHMSDIPSFPYSLLWEERAIKSVANLTRKDGVQFMNLAPQIPIRTEVHPYPLEKANEALDDMRNGRMKGAAVLVV